MGVVIPFRRARHLPLAHQDAALLNRLRNSQQALRYGGWAEPGEETGVVLKRNRHDLGIWAFVHGRYRYRPIATGEAVLSAGSLEEAHALTLAILGEPPPPGAA